MNTINLYDYLNTKQLKRVKNYRHIKKEDMYCLETGMKICLFKLSNFQFRYAGTLINYDDTFLIIKNMKNYNQVIPFDDYVVFAKNCSKKEQYKTILENLSN